MSVNTFTEGDAVGLNANSADPTQFFDEGCSRATATDTFFNADYIAVLGGNTVRRDTSLPLDLESRQFSPLGSHGRRGDRGRPILRGL